MEKELNTLLKEIEETACPNCKRLIVIIKEIEARNRNLEAKIEEHKATTPSGMKPTYEKRNIKTRRKKPGCKIGHQGFYRKIPKEVHIEKDWTLATCPDCGTELGKPIEIRERYTEDLPTIEILVTKHRIYRYLCKGCKRIVEPKVLDALPKSRLGLNILLMTVWLHYALGTTVKNIIAWLKTLCYFKLKIPQILITM
ncbi:MAG: IS66 family transposase zinc-finger binding domain-containing protein [bacterium]